MGSLPANTMDKLAPANTLTSSPANNDELLTFDLFPDFPFEIRRQIWEIAVDDLEPRVVEICFEGNYLKESITTQTASPAALSTCHESREVAFARYETLTIEGVHTGAMINWSLDTLFVNASTISQRMADRLNDAVIQSKCRRLALGREFFYGFTFTKDSVLQSLPSVFLRKFKRIEELIVVMEEEEPSVVDFLENGRLLKSMRRDGGFMFEPTNDAIAKSQITRDHIRLALARNLNVLSANTVTVIASTEAKRDKHPQMLLDVDASEGEDPMFPQIPVQAHAAQAQLAQLWGFPISAMHNSASRVSIHLGVQREITTMSIDRIKATTRLLEQKMKKEEDPRQRAKNYGNLSRFVRRLHHLIP